MAIIQSGAIVADPASAIVDTTYKALRSSFFPPQNAGVFRLRARSGNIAAATAAGIQFSFRYTGEGECSILSVKVGLNITTAYTARTIAYTLVPVRAFPNPDTGGTAVVPQANQKNKTNMLNSLVQIIIPSTGIITAGTGNIEDANPMGFVVHDLPSIITNAPMIEMMNYGPYNRPLTLTRFEGFRIRNTAYAAAGVSNLTVQVEWKELHS